MTTPLILTILLCLIVGGAIDTGNVCVVRAAVNINSGKPAMAVSILFAGACASVVFYLNSIMGLLREPAPWSYPTLVTIAGAILFAVGALVNGACAVGTVGRLARGDIGSLATLAGALLVGFVIPRTVIASQTPDLQAMTGATWLEIVLAFTAVLMILSRRELRARRLVSYAIIGVAGAVVTNWQGNWTWLTLIQEIEIGMPLQYAAVACIAAVLVGAAVTAVVKGHFHFIRPDIGTMLREALGGGLMVAGATLIPGGNDALLVYGIPSGSPHAIIGYAVMFAVLLLVLQAQPALSRLTAGAGPGATR